MVRTPELILSNPLIKNDKKMFLETVCVFTPEELLIIISDYLIATSTLNLLSVGINPAQIVDITHHTTQDHLKSIKKHYKRKSVRITKKEHV